MKDWLDSVGRDALPRPRVRGPAEAVRTAPADNVTPPQRILVIGLGNDYRRDDAVGRVVARRLKSIESDNVRVLEESGEGAALIEAWQEADLVILIDAVQSGGSPGSTHRFDTSAQPVPTSFFHYSTHAFSVAEAIELARKLGRLPSKLIVYGIEGKSFEAGVGLSPEVERAAEQVLQTVKEELSMASQ